MQRKINTSQTFAFVGITTHESFMSIGWILMERVQDKHTNKHLFTYQLLEKYNPLSTKIR